MYKNKIKISNNRREKKNSESKFTIPTGKHENESHTIF